MLAWLIIASAILAASAGPAATTVRPIIAVGDGTISGARLRPYSNAWMFSVRRSDGTVRDQGIWSDVLRWREVDGRKLFERVQGMTYATGQTSVTINRFDPDTLAPVYSEQHGPDGRIIKRTFNGHRVETRETKSPGVAESARTANLPTAVYDFNGGMYGMLLAAQPLKLGYSAVIPAIGEFDENYTQVPFHVVRRETIHAGFKGRIRAWVVQVDTQTPMTFWLSENPPYILRLTFPVRQGEAVYNMID